MVGLDNIANEITGGAPTIELVTELSMNLITIDTSDASPAMNFPATWRFYSACFFGGSFDLFFLITRSPLVMPVKKSKKSTFDLSVGLPNLLMDR